MSAEIVSQGQISTKGRSGRRSTAADSRSAEESRQLLHALLEELPLAIMVLDCEGRVRLWSPTAESVFGWSAEEITGNLVPILSESELHNLPSFGPQSIPKCSPETVRRRKDGVIVDVTLSFAPLRNVDGAVTGVVILARTEEDRARLLEREKAARNEAEQINRLRAELLARERAERARADAARREWQTTFDTMTDAVMLVDREDQLIRANRAFYARAGVAAEEAVGQPVTTLLHRPGSRYPAETCPICALRRQGKHGSIEIAAASITGRPVVATIDPVLDDLGNTIAVVQVSRDLTELYRAREEAERERTSLNATIEQMAEGLMVFDPSSGVIRANRNAQRIFGFTLEEMTRDRDLKLPRDRFTDEAGEPVPVLELPIQRALREQKIIDSRLWYIRPGQQKVLLAITASPFFDEHERLAGAIALIRDVTEQQREYERSHQADKLRALGQLASGVAHNFNNALAAVIGYTQLAIPKANDPDVARYLRVVEQSAKDAARMVERIQTFARRRVGTENFTDNALMSIVRDAIDITEPRWRNDAEALGIQYEVSFEWNAEEDLMVIGEPSELREVFVNVIFNALDAMPIGGSLKISATVQANEVRIWFVDTGGGMTEEIKRRIFEPFFTTKGVSGLGMGMSESYRIVERHGGRIEIESRLRRGTTITISLPIADPNAKESSASGQPRPIRTANILILDDEPFVRGFLSTILSELGHSVVEASDAENALELIRESPFDVVFTDLAMPGTDGIAAAIQIKALRPETKIVLMSGYGADKAYERAGNTDCIDAAISKPFQLVELHKVLESIIPSDGPASMK